MIARAVASTLCLWLVCVRHSLADGDATKGYFNGDSYAEYVLHAVDERVRGTSNLIELQFRTVQPNGLLLHGSSSGREYGDYFTIELIGGRLRFALSLGRHLQGSKDDKKSITLGYGLADNKFHSVKIDHNGHETWVILDDLMKGVTMRRIETRYKELYLDEFLFIGGAHVLSGIRDVMSGSNFKGCLKGVYITSGNSKRKDLLQVIAGVATLKKYDVNDTCDDNLIFDPVTVNGRRGQFSIIISSNVNKLRAKLRFRTYQSSGTVMSMSERFQLSFTKQSITLTVFIGDSKTRVIQQQIFKNKPINTGLWHNVEFEISAANIWINVNGMVDIRPPSAEFPANFFKSNVRVGGDFVGCVWDIVLNGNKFDIKTLTQSAYREKGTCGITDFCFPNVCQHGGKCSQNGKTFACDCLGTNYKGAVCQFSEYARTCWELRKDDPELETGYYTIDPDGSGPEKPFQTICIITATELDGFGEDISRVWTEVKSEDHNVPLLKYPPADARKPESVIRDVVYRPSFQAAQTVAMASEYCKQFVEYLCTGSRLLNSLNPSYGHWVGSHGKHYYYWGGSGPQYQGKCACGVRGDCLDNKGCNCDARRSTLESDEGYLFGSNGKVLPTSQVLFGDVDIDDDHYANYTVGPLLCYGRPNNTVTFSREDGILHLRYREGSLDGDHGDVSFYFRTPYPHGILFRQGEIIRQTKDFIQVEIVSCYTVKLSWDVGDGPKSISVTVTGNPLNTNRLWHKVVVWFNVKEFGLEVDGIKKRKDNPLQQGSYLDVVGTLQIGGYVKNLMAGFVGCIRGFTLKGKIIDLVEFSQDYDYVSAGCHSACTNNTQCKGGARCIDDFNIYKCDCHLTPFYGYFCERDYGANFAKMSSLKYTFPGIQRDAWGTDIAVGFKTRQCSGTVMELKSNTPGHYFRISIQKNDKLVFKHHTSTSDGAQEISPPKGSSFCDDKRHTFSLERKKDFIIWKVDGGVEMRETVAHLTAAFESPKELLIGTIGGEQFEGCISAVKITNWPNRLTKLPTVEPIKQLLYDNNGANIVAQGVSKSKCGEWYEVPSVPTRPIPGPHGPANVVCR